MTKCKVCDVAHRVLAFTLLVAVVVVTTTLVAVAQTTTGDTTISLYDVFGPWLTQIAGAVSLVLMGFLGWVAEVIRQKTGLQIEAFRSETLQTALTNGAGKIIVSVGDKLKDIRFDVRSPVIKEAVDYVLRSAPDAVKYFGLSPDQIAEKLLAKLGVITAANPEVSPIAVTPTIPPAH